MIGLRPQKGSSHAGVLGFRVLLKDGAYINIYDLVIGNCFTSSKSSS